MSNVTEQGLEKSTTRALSEGLGQTCRVFLVEDNIDDQFFSKKLLETSDQVASVKCFSDGQELIEYMKKQGFQDHSVLCMTPTIIVVDLNMPRMNGFKVLEHLKSDPFLEEIPVIAISGVLSHASMRRALDLRADAVLRKPLSLDKLKIFLEQGWQWPTREMWMS